MKIKAIILNQLWDGTRNRAVIEVKSNDKTTAVSGQLVITTGKPLPQLKKGIIIDIPEK